MWQQPNIDWRESDFFNIQDYNRIKGNLMYLEQLANTMYPTFKIPDMGPDKTYKDYGFYADEINRLEENLEHIKELVSYAKDTGEPKTYGDNQPFIDYVELNRLEGAIYDVYHALYSQRTARRRLSLRCGQWGEMRGYRGLELIALRQRLSIRLGTKRGVKI